MSCRWDPRLGQGCGTDCTAFAAFLFLFCFTIAFLRLPLTASLYICFHNTLQIVGFNNVSLEALLYAFGASIIEAQHWHSLLIMGFFVCLFLFVKFFMGMLSRWKVFALAATGHATLHSTLMWPECIIASTELSLRGLGRFLCPLE